MDVPIINFEDSYYSILCGFNSNKYNVVDKAGLRVLCSYFNQPLQHCLGAKDNDVAGGGGGAQGAHASPFAMDVINILVLRVSLTLQLAKPIAIVYSA